MPFPLRYLPAVLFLIGALCAPTPGAAALEAGAAKVDITPPPGVPLNGYGARMGRVARGAHDPIWARALYLDDGETRLFLVNTDLCMINRELRARVLELAPGAVPKEHVILTATHTHSGPGGMHRHLPLRFVAGDFRPDVLEETAQGIARAMREAHAARTRAAIGYATTDQDTLSANRRVPGGPIDKQIGVIRVDDADGNTLAIVTNFAAHPTSVGGADQFNFSADYCGFYYAAVEEMSSPGCVALFLNGAQGNQTIGNPEGKAGWERTESVGRLLAARAKAAANKIACDTATLRVAYAEPRLPQSIAPFVPETTVVQTLEIDDLAISFLPGEPVVEIGLELRKRALAAGYRAHFTVGLANDYLMYFVPRRFYAQDNYEAHMNFHGPGIKDWLLREFGAQWSRAEPVDPDPDPPALEVEEAGGGLHVRLAAAPRDRGFQRGRYFAEDFRLRHDRHVVEAVRSGPLRPTGGIMDWLPPVVDPAPLAVTALAQRARPLLAGVAADAFAEMEGMAEGAGLPFDAVWLLQQAQAIASRADRTPFMAFPLCTVFAVGSGRDLLVGRNLDWPVDEVPLVVRTPKTDTNREFVSVGFSWNAGVFSGMNDAGLVATLEAAPQLGDPPTTGPTAEFVLRDMLARADSLDSAATMLAAQKHLRGYHVLLAGPTGTGYGARVAELGSDLHWRDVDDGVLLGTAPETPELDSDARLRYTRAAALIAGGGGLDLAGAKALLTDAEPGREGDARIWNARTRHSVVFEPARKRLHVAFPSADGRPGPWTTVVVDGGGGS